VHQNAFAAGILPRTPVTALPRLPRWNLWRGGEKKKKREDRGGKKKDGGRWEKERRAQ